ncbi:RHS repeat-associated core domain-containing protein [Rhodanobacter sp. UC4451_H18]
MATKVLGQTDRFATRLLLSLMVLLAPLCIAPVAQAQVGPGDGGGGSGAGGIPTWVEYSKRLDATQHISALENGFSGEHVSLSNGATSFSVTDIDVPGNFPLPVQLVRGLAIELQPQDGIQAYDALLRGAGNWDIEVPFMAATYPAASGWNAQRCSQGSVPSISFGPNGAFSRGEVWQGIAIHVPGRGDATALGLDSSSPVPSSGGPYRLTTAERDMFDCIAMKSGLSGEGFRMTTSAGVRYYFDVGVSRTASKLATSIVPSQGELPVMVYLARNRYYLLASKIEDRFGNTVQFQYDANGHPTRIWASDGREITLLYSNGRLSSASSHGRTWQYQYNAAGNLTNVVLPDASRWQYAYTGSLTPPSPPPIENLTLPWCQGTPAIIGETYTLAATHPSGATASFHFENRRHYRSGVHASECMQLGPPDAPDYKLLVPYFFDVMSLTEKSLNGPGMAGATWDYAYDSGGSLEHLWGSHTEPANYPCTTCRQYKTNTVTNPDRSQQRYRFGIVYALNDGRLLQQETVRTDGSVIRTEVNQYLSESAAASQPFYAQYGYVLGNVADPLTARIRPTTSTVITQDGATFTTTTNTFDTYARAIKQTEASSLGYSRISQTAYYDNTSKWVLGQVAQGKIGSVTASSTTFDPNTALPLTYSAFGKLKQTITWNGDGTIATVKDGNNNVTTASSWKRGIPQIIGYPDGTSESASVSDAGWIAWVKDQKGYTTSYGYNAMGRLASISYPTGDDVAWNQTLLSFARMGSSEYGIPAGHWKQTVHTGNGYTVTYFDGMWRPLVTEQYDSANKASTLSQTVQRYDSTGRKVFTSYPINNVASYATVNSGSHTSYDALSRATQVTQDSELGLLATTTAYLSGFKTVVTDPKGNVTTTAYMAFGQPTTDWPVRVDAPAGVTQVVSRDAFGKPLNIAQSGSFGGYTAALTKTFVYDGYQRLCRFWEPESGSTVLDYDNAGNVVWRAQGQAITGGCGQDQVSAGSKISYTYDVMNRLTAVTTPAGTDDRSFTYDANGNRITDSTTQMGAVNYYNRRDMPTGRLIGIDGHFWGTGDQYDANGHLASTTYPDGRVVAYAPDALGRAHQAGSYASNVGYFPDGGVESYTLGNGISRLSDRNARQLPSNLTYAKGGGLLYSQDFSYDANANLTTVNGLVDNRDSATYGYDALNRLTSASAPLQWGSESYAYDTLNNLRRRTVNGTALSLNVDSANRLISSTIGASLSAAYQNDARGNRVSMTSGGTTTAYTFDTLNQLVEVPGLANYAYDANGRRVRRTLQGGAPKYSFYSVSGKLMFTYDVATAQGTDYIYLGGTLIASHGVAASYILTDRLGSRAREADASGNIVASFSYQPYGGIFAGPMRNEPEFIGHVYDPGTGLTYMQARYYDSGTGRFLSVDPVGPVSGNVFNFNRFGYANNSPIVNIDPDGRLTGSLLHPHEAGVVGPGYTVLVNPSSGGGSSRQQVNQVNILGGKVGVSYSDGVSDSDRVITGKSIQGASNLINSHSSSLSGREKAAIERIRQVKVTGDKTYLGAVSGDIMSLSASYIKDISEAWLASLFGHEGQHILNAGQYWGDNQWMNEQSAGATQLSIGRKLGFTREEVRYLEKWIDPIGNEKGMQSHMEQGYGH